MIVDNQRIQIVIGPVLATCVLRHATPAENSWKHSAWRATDAARSQDPRIKTEAAMMNSRTPRMAGDLMKTDVVTLEEDDRLEHLELAMRAMKFRHLPVVDTGRRVVGLVSQHDLLRTSSSTLLPEKNRRDQFVNERFRVRDIMTNDVFTVPPATPLTQVAEQMMTRKLGCIPVCDESNRILGIITEEDFVRLSLELLES